MKKQHAGQRLISRSLPIKLENKALAISIGYFLVGFLWVVVRSYFLPTMEVENHLFFSQQAIFSVLFFATTSFALYFLISKIMNLGACSLALQKIHQDNFLLSHEPQIVYREIDSKVLEYNRQLAHVLEIENKLEEPVCVRELFKQSPDCKEFLLWLKKTEQESAALAATTIVNNNGRKLQISSALGFSKGKKKRYRVLFVKEATENRRYAQYPEHAVSMLDLAREAADVGYWEINLSAGCVFLCEIVMHIFDLPIPANVSLELKALQAHERAKIFNDIANSFESNGDAKCSVEYRFLDSQGNSRHVLILAHEANRHGEKILIGAVVDKTEQKQFQKEFLQRQAQWDYLVEALPEGIGIIQDSHLVYANKAVIKMLKATDASQVYGKPILTFVDQRDIESVKNRMRAVVNGEKNTEGFQYRRLVCLDGSGFEVEIAANKISYKGSVAIQIVIRDLTEIMKAQEALESANRRLSSLSSRTLDMIERERKRIAGELHDDVGQSLTAIKLMTHWLKNRLTDRVLQSKTEDIQKICENTLETVRNLSLMLRPAQLDSLGLPAAISWQADTLFSNNAVHFHLESKNFDEIKDKDAEIIAFRVLQESLTNIARHSDADSAKVVLETQVNCFYFEVIDNGVGFDVNEQRNSTGLINMKERVELANGVIDVHSIKGVGTKIVVTLPTQRISQSPYATNAQNTATNNQKRRKTDFI